ncbi:hypothetical protein NQ176_g5256 [Zarea fungicola]|uniref:Uncharacterized protein n=1 Tax=Zarea fungicola TaxID=93591 RepID=A0ACC1NBN3_9HYPO|nr:hypothetical protein NQ176_g5256 [Lecanicillium fungicola]
MPTEFPSVKSLREAVCNTHYWAALYISPRSSEILARAIAGSNSSDYDPSNIIAYIWNEARYPTVVDGSIANNMQMLSERARNAYIALHGTVAFATIPPNNSAAITAFTNPWILSSTNIKPTIQGTRAVYNTIVSPFRIIMVRDMISGIFTMIGSLLATTAIWVFRATWDMSGKQFALTWLTLWLFSHVTFLTLDVFTVWIPHQFVSMALVTWVVFNVTSIILPFELSSPFYRWAYAVPAHGAYEVLTDVWSDGCSPHLYYALPVLFAYEMTGLFWTSLGIYKRCHFAVLTEETSKEAMRMRVEMALKLEREHDASLGRKGKSTTRKDSSGRDLEPEMAVQNVEQVQSAQEQELIEREIEHLGDEIERLQTRASRMTDFGPSFPLVGADRDN